MKKLVLLTAALSCIAAIPAYAATHVRDHNRHYAATHHYRAMAPTPRMAMIGNPFRDQDMIVSHVAGVRE